ncbi:MAG: hypothetical protein LBI59_00270 [Candidatus Accumulibacter sp.]|jgi:hypothetical protein|nr:hypothetical protein [Accumulibacter sp.]
MTAPSASVTDEPDAYEIFETLYARIGFLWSSHDMKERGEEISEAERTPDFLPRRWVVECFHSEKLFGKLKV